MLLTGRHYALLEAVRDEGFCRGDFAGYGRACDALEDAGLIEIGLPVRYWSVAGERFSRRRLARLTPKGQAELARRPERICVGGLVLPEWDRVAIDEEKGLLLVRTPEGFAVVTTDLGGRVKRVHCEQCPKAVARMVWAGAKARR